MAKVGTGYDLEKDKASPTDLCVYCGVDTGIPKDLPVYEGLSMWRAPGSFAAPATARFTEIAKLADEKCSL